MKVFYMLEVWIVAKATGPVHCSAVFVVALANGRFLEMCRPYGRAAVLCEGDGRRVVRVPFDASEVGDVLLLGLDATAREDSNVAHVAIVSSWCVEFSGALPRWGKGHTPAARTVPSTVPTHMYAPPAVVVFVPGSDL